MTDLSAYIPEMVETRRRFHRYPEIAWTEFLTTQTIIERVRALGFETVVGKALFDIKHAFGRNEEMIQEAFQEALGQGLDPKIGEEIGGFTGCLAIWETPRPGPVTALRFDIDCVNVEEDHTDNNEAFREGFDSSRSGLMHACGHDGHAAIGLAVARWIKDNADQLCGTIKLIFQPAEEGTKGAAGIAYSDNLDDVDVILGAHLGVAAKLHEVAIVRSGFLNTTKMNATFKGTPAHSGSCAEKGRNALMAACTASLQLMGIARHGGGNSNVNVGTIHAGEGRNVVPVNGRLEFEVRGETQEINRYMQETAERMVRGAAESYGVQSRTEIVGMAVDIHSDDDLCEMLREVCKTVSSVQRVFEHVQKAGSEDYSLLAQKVQSHGGKSVFFFCGCNHPGHHRANFAIQDKESLPECMEIFVKMIQRINGLAC